MTWTFLTPTATWLATARPSSTRVLPSATSSPISSPAGDERDGEAAASASPRELGAELGEAERLPRAAGLRVARPQVELLARSVEEVHVAGARAEQRARVRRDRLQELVERLRSRDRLRELGELLELRDPEPGLLVLARVLDRARDERGRGHDEVHLVVGELPRGLGVRGDRADRLTRATDDRYREQRLVAVLVELRDVLHPGIGERVLADESRLAVLRGPPREALAPLERDLPDLAFVRRRRRAHDQTVVLDEVDEAAVDAARVRHEANDGRQHFGELDRRGDGRDDLLEELLARLQGHRA